MRWVVLLAVSAGMATAQTAAPPDPVVAIFQSARSSLADVPDAARPLDRLAIAQAEDIRHSDMALDDYAQAFREAVALPRPADPSSLTARWVEGEKQRVERAVMQALTQVHGTEDFTLAHQLARLADIRRGPLYDLLISSAAEQAGNNGGPRRVSEEPLLFQIYGVQAVHPRPQLRPTDLQPPYDVEALVQECRQADGSFPYLGVVTALDAYRVGGVAPLPLLHLALDAAAAETNLVDMNAALALLSRTHYFVPALDGPNESAAVAMFTRLAAMHLSGLDEVNRGLIGSRVLGLIRRLDPDRAQELAAQYPALSVAPTLARRPAPRMPAGAATDNSDPGAALDAAEALPAATDVQRRQKLQALLQAANTLAALHPAQARQAAGEAMDLLSDSLLRADLRPAELLALRLATDMHDPAAAHALILRCLDQAEAMALASEQRYDASGHDSRLAQAAAIAGDNELADAFAYAARIDFPLALQRAQQTSAAYLKPLFLERVAVGREMLHPWWSMKNPEP
ncbi:MAG: hypothetical protein ACTHJX_11055 [Terriglobales bacterium]